MLRFRYIVLIIFITLLILHLILGIVWKITRKDILNIYFKKIFTFILPITIILCCIFGCSAILAKKEYGPNMDEQIKQQFRAIDDKQYDTIILGNSRLYRGINPELLNSNCYNFAFDNDSFLECYYKIKYLEKIDKLPKCIILGVDYFEFSFVSAGMQATYDLYFDKEYDNVIANCQSLSFDTKSNFDKKINKLINNFCIMNYYNATSYLFNRFILKDKRVSYVSEYGQYKIYPQPKATLGDYLTRSSLIMNEQKEAYLKIFELAEQNNITIVQVMLPTRDIELNCYTVEEKNQLDQLFNSQNKSIYMNFSQLEDFNINYFMDDTHLNLKGADKFSSILNEKLINNKLFVER